MTTLAQMIEQVNEFQIAQDSPKRQSPFIPDHTPAVEEALKACSEHLFSLEKWLKTTGKVNNKDECLRRVAGIVGELAEFVDALEKRSTVAVFDAQLDILYYLFGSFNQYGTWQIATDGFNEVHDSNMSKICANGKLIADETGRAIKPEGYRPPDLVKFIIDSTEAAEEVSKII